CRDFATLFGRPYTVLRYGIPFGPRMRTDLVVAAFLLRAMRGEPLRIDGDGSQERRFVYVSDLAAAHVLALRDVAENRTYNLESDEAISIRTLAETVRDLVGLVDELVVVDDGSSDNTRCEIELWMHGRPRCHLLVHETNQGMSEAYYTALTELRERLRVGDLHADDLVFTVDADGQHDLHVLND